MRGIASPNVQFEYFASLMGRILIGGFFLWSGIDAAINLTGTMLTFAEAGAWWPTAFAVITVAVESLGGLALITGYKVRLSALVLVAFILATSPLLTNFADNTQMAMFFRNMAIVGGLLILSATRR